MHKSSIRAKQWKKLLFLYSFFMSFPSVLLFGLNVSVFIFVFMFFFAAMYKPGSIIGFRKGLQWVALFFAFGAVLSTLNIPENMPAEAFDRALKVLPNYIYWSILIIFLITNRYLIDLKTVYKGVFWGLLATLCYYLVLQQFLHSLPMLNRQSPNNFAFVLICYTPIAVYYLDERKGRFWAILLLMFLLLILLRDGRRAGLVLVLAGGIGVLYGRLFRWENIVGIGLTSILFWMFLYSDPVEKFILHNSERVHALLYQTDKIWKEDRSFLIRVAQVKKGLAIYDRYPYTGIGLNNFSKFEISFDKSFEGAEYVAYKRGINEKSSHNSYINLLAEGGLFLLVPFLLLLGTNLFYGLINYNNLDSRRPVYLGVFMMAVHFYFITAIVNVFAWYLLGLASALIYRK